MKHYIYIAMLFLIIGILEIPAFAQQYYFNKCYEKQEGSIFNAAALETPTSYLVFSNRYVLINGVIQSSILLRSISKIDGTEIWTKPLIILNEEIDTYFGRQLVLLNEEQFALAGLIYKVYNGERVTNMFLIEADIKGELSCFKEYGELFIHERYDDLAISPDSTYILGGYLFNYEQPEDKGAGIMKLNKDKTKAWEKLYKNPIDTSLIQAALTIYPTSDGGYLFSGFRQKPNAPYITPLTKMYVTKIDSLGNIQNDLTLKDDDEDDAGCGLFPYPNKKDRYLLVGSIGNLGSNYFAEIHEMGIVFWDKKVYIDKVFDISQISFNLDGSFVCKGIYMNENNQTEAWLGKFSKDIELQWQHHYTTNPAHDHYIRGMLPTSDGGYLLTGFNYDELYAWELKVDSLGNTCWFNAPPQWEEATDTQGNIALQSYWAILSNQAYQRNPLVEKGKNNNIDSNIPQQVALNVLPNPATTYIRIDLAGTTLKNWNLYDIQGKCVLNGKTPYISVTALPTGMYLLQVDSQEAHSFRTKVFVKH